MADLGSWRICGTGAVWRLGVVIALALSARGQDLVALAKLPDDPGQAAVENVSGEVTGTIEDSRGALVAGARVTLLGQARAVNRVVVTDSVGRFRFVGVSAGTVRLSVVAAGFAGAIVTGTLNAGQSLEVPAVMLPNAANYANVVVTATASEIAAAQVSMEEKQNVLGVFPNFYVSYIPDASPLTTRQKFGLAWKSSIVPGSFVVAGMVAGVEQATDGFSGYGQGAKGFAKRFGASYTDDFVSTMVGGAILPSLLHQDPRYFYKGTGSFASRARYAVSTVVICKNDSGKWVPNYSNVLGNIAAAGISNLYYPESDRHGAGLTVENALIGTALGGVSALFQEFFVKRLTPHVPNYGPGKP